MSQIEVKIPDIGGAKDLPVIELSVAVGDQVEAEDALLSIESDKAVIDIPSPVAGTVTALLVKEGDTVSEGTSIVMIESSAAAAEPAAAKPAAAAETSKSASTAAAASVAAPKNTAQAFAGNADMQCELLVLGAGQVAIAPPFALRIWA